METNAKTFDASPAYTIYQQLGGTMFARMVGLKGIAWGDDPVFLSLHIGRNPKGISRVYVYLTPDDLYRVSFYSARNKTAPRTELDGVYADQLAAVFTEHTGLYTRF